MGDEWVRAAGAGWGWGGRRGWVDGRANCVCTPHSPVLHPSLQATVGGLVAKTLSSAAAGAFYRGVAPPPVALDVFSVQVSGGGSCAGCVGLREVGTPDVVTRRGGVFIWPLPYSAPLLLFGPCDLLWLSPRTTGLR